MNVALVIIMGVAVVFIGLVCIVLLCMAMSFIVKAFEKPALPDDKPAVAAAPAVSPDPGPRGEVVAAIAAVLAEELGEDVSAIRILSLKKVN